MSASFPLTYWVAVADVPPNGLNVFVEADARERAALAADFKLPSIESLEGRFHIVRTSLGLHVSGRVAARVTQICAVSLEPFENQLREQVDVDFADPALAPPDASLDGPAGEDAPDPIVGGRIDVGALTAEFLSLGLDPYPRKPGVAFSFEDPQGAAAASPFSALAQLKPKSDRP